MSEVSVESLFDEFAVAYRRGERPDVGAYLARVAEGAERDGLADLIDRFLQASPAREPSEEEVVLLQARLESEPPLLLLRLRRALTRAAIVDALVGRLDVDPQKRDKVAAYYHRLEVGTLDPEPVDRRVWDVLAELLRANAQRLASLGQPTGSAPVVAPAYHRVQDAPELAAPPALMDRVAFPEEPDEVDRLFTGTS